MSADSNEKKSRLSHLPGILGGSAALIAALTTVYVNVRKDDHASAPAIPAASLVPAPSAVVDPSASPVPAGPVRRVLQLERLRVENDGSLGSTDWTFEVSAAGEPQYSLTFKSLNDREGQNLTPPPPGARVSATIETAAGAPVEVSVKGWKRSLMPRATAPDIVGVGSPVAGASTFAVHAVSDRDGGPDITLYFSLTAVAQGRE